MTTVASCSSVIVIIQANYNHCNEIAIATLGGIYAISCLLKFLVQLPLVPEKAQYLCPKGTNEVQVFTYDLKDEGKQMPLVFLFLFL